MTSNPLAPPAAPWRPLTPPDAPDALRLQSVVAAGSFLIIFSPLDIPTYDPTLPSVGSGRCRPGTVTQQDCNTCRCLSSGGLACTRKACFGGSSGGGGGRPRESRAGQPVVLCVGERKTLKKFTLVCCSHLLSSLKDVWRLKHVLSRTSY